MRDKAEIIQDLFGTLERQDMEGMQALVTSDIEFDVSANVFNPAVWQGRTGLESWASQASEVWLPPKITLVGLEELDDGRVISAVLVENVGRESGATATMSFWQVWTFRDGLIARIAHFNEERLARREAGLAT